MIQQVLQQTMPQEYGLARKNVAVSISNLTGSFSLKDEQRCAQCKTKQTIPCTEEVMLITANNQQVTLVDNEAYVNQFNGTGLGTGRRCDYLLLDDNTNYKLAFCDLSCAKEDTVEPNPNRTHLPEGKREKCIQQLTASIKRFTSRDSTKAYIENFTQKHCIFGWKDPFVMDNQKIPGHGDTEANMQIFGMATSNNPLLLATIEIDGISFTYYQVKYPSVYKW